MKQYVRPYSEVKALMAERAAKRSNPFEHTRPEEARRILDQLDTYDYEPWAAAFSAAAGPYEDKAHQAEQAGDTAAARENYLLAYGYHHVARYPCPNSPGKERAYRAGQQNLLRAGRYMDPPLEWVEMPFKGRPGEGAVLPGLLRRPRGEGRLPALLVWGGIDGFKEERRVDAFLARGFATLAIDMPGVGDAPIPGSEDAERMFDAAFDWIAAQPWLDATRVLAWGGSTGGYWVVKLVHTHRERLAGGISQGGAVHYAFQPEWIEKAQHGEYPFELAETLARAFGRTSFDEWVEYAPKLSLLDMGILDRPCAPLLSVNGLQDTVFPISDQYVVLEHGDPKSMRLFDAVHMGWTPDTMRIMVDWAAERCALNS